MSGHQVFAHNWVTVALLLGPVPNPRPSPPFSHPVVALPGRALGDVHAAPLRAKVLVERLVQDEAVDEAAAHVQVGVLAVHVERDVLPLRVRQVHVLEGHHVLRAVRPVDQVQGVGAPVRHDLQLPALAGALQAQQGAPRAAVLPHCRQEHEALVVLHLPQDLAEHRRAHRVGSGRSG